MKKITLDLDSLAVHSFVAGGDAAGRGTVQGHAVTEFVCSWLPTCPDQPTCGGKTC